MQNAELALFLHVGKNTHTMQNAGSTVTDMAIVFAVCVSLSVCKF